MAPEAPRYVNRLLYGYVAIFIALWISGSTLVIWLALAGLAVFFLLLLFSIRAATQPVDGDLPAQPFAPASERWQAVLITQASKRGRPEQRQTVFAQSREDLNFQLVDHYGRIEAAGLYDFTPLRICGVKIRARAELIEPLDLPATAFYNAEAERWRQKQERPTWVTRQRSRR